MWFYIENYKVQGMEVLYIKSDKNSIGKYRPRYSNNNKQGSLLKSSWGTRWLAKYNEN